MRIHNGLEFIMDNVKYIITLFLQLIYVDGYDAPFCPSQTVTRYERITSFSLDPIRKNYANIVISNCKFGKEQHITNLEHCFDHCSLRDNCVAIYKGD